MLSQIFRNGVNTCRAGDVYAPSSMGVQLFETLRVQCVI